MDAAGHWSELPPELLQSISRKLPILADYARFRSVCTSWRSAAAPSDLPSQLPWLMLPPKSPSSDDPITGDDQIFDHDNGALLHFFSLADRSLYRIHLPETRNRTCYTVGHGLLLVVGRGAEISEIFLLNPLTRARIPLPPRTTFPEGISRSAEVNPVLYFNTRGNPMTKLELEEMTYRWFLDQAVLSSDPATSAANWVLVVCVNISWKMAFCRPGDQAWTMLELLDPVPHPMGCFNGNLYSVHFGSGLHVSTIDVTLSPAMLTAYSSVAGVYSQSYLVESAGKLLLVGSLGHVAYEGAAVTMTVMYHVFKMEMTEKTPRWPKVYSIGDQALFLSHDSAVSVCASDLPLWCRPNCIYYPNCSRTLEGHLDHDICVFDLADNSTSRVHCCQDDSVMWERAAWILPSLC